MLTITDLKNKTHEEIVKECYLYAEKNNWEASKILQNVKFPFLIFQNYVKEYIKKNNINPTVEKILFFSHHAKTYCKSFTDEKMIQFMIDEGLITSDLDKIYEKILYFCCVIKIRKGKEFCDEKGLSFDVVSQYSDFYIKRFLSTKDFLEDEIMKICYDKYEENNWDTKKIGYDLKISIEESGKYVYKYMKENLNKELTKEQIWVLLSPSSKNIFRNYNNIIKLMFDEKIINDEQMKDPLWLNKNLRFYLCKFCFDVSVKFNWNLRAIRYFCYSKDIRCEQIKNLSFEYVDSFLSKEDKQNILKVQKEAATQNWIEAIDARIKSNPPDYVFVLNNIMTSTLEQEIIDIIESYDKTFTYLKRCIDSYLKFYNDFKYTEEQIEKKLEIYENYLKNKRIEDNELRKQKKYQLYVDENIDIARQIINQYLNEESEKIKDFCDANDIDIKTFEEYVNLIKDNDEELYSKYSEQRDSIQSKRFSILLTKANKIIKLIKNGIEENGIKRDFDLVDYYKNTSLSFEELLHVVEGKVGAEDYRALRMFIAKNKNDKEMTPRDISNLYNTKIVIGAQFDYKRNIIPGTGREITKEEKQSIVKYLEYNNIRVTNTTYNIIYRKWLSGDLVINEDINSKKR